MGELSDLQKFRAQTYFEEYRAMMARVNFFMSLQFIPVAPTVAFIGVAFAARRHLDSTIVVWGVVTVLEIAALTYYFALYEVYQHVRYIESVLKPRVAAIVRLNAHSFWDWESYLRDVGKAYHRGVGDFVPASLCLVADAFALAFLSRRTALSLADYLGGASALSLTLGVVLLAIRVWRSRGPI